MCLMKQGLLSLAAVIALGAALRRGAPDAPDAFGWLIGAGILAGLAALAKSSALVLGPFACAALLLSAWRRGRRSMAGLLRPALAWSVAAALGSWH